MLNIHFWQTGPLSQNGQSLSLYLHFMDTLFHISVPMFIQKFQMFINSQLQGNLVFLLQRLTILYQLCKLGNKIRLCRDPDQFDFTLSFLDTYLSQCIEQGASPYKPRHLRLGTKTEGNCKSDKYSVSQKAFLDNFLSQCIEQT